MFYFFAAFANVKIPAVVEFISNYDAEHHRSTVRGREVHLTLENIRNALRLHVGRTMCPRLKQKQHVADWFDYYDGLKKTYWSNMCLKPSWAPIFELLNAILLCRRYPKEVRGVLIWYVKTKVDPDGNPDHEDLDWASIVRKDWESEISFLQNHWWTDKYEGKSRTCFGQTMTQFLMHMGIIHAGEPEDGAPAVVVPEEEDPPDHISDGDTEVLEQGSSEGTGGWDTSDFDTLDVGLGHRTLENTLSTGRSQTHEAGPSSSYQGVRADARPLAVERREHEPATSGEWMQSIRQISTARPETTEQLEPTASGTDTGGGSSTGRRRWEAEGEDDDDDVCQTRVRSPGASAQHAQGHPGEGGDQNQSTSSPASGTLPADFVGTVDPNRSKGKTVDIPSRSSPSTRAPEDGEGSAFDLGLLHWEAASILAEISRAETGAEKRKRIVESSESDMDSPKRLKEYVTSPVRNMITGPEPVLSIDAQAGNLAANKTSREAETEAPAERTREDRGKRPVDESEDHPEVDSSRKNSLQLEQSMLENMEKLGETLEFLMKQEENPEKLIQALDSLMKTKGRDGLAEILKEALDFLMKHKGREGLEDNLGTEVDSAKDASASDEQRHGSSEGTPQPGPSARTAENFAEAARNYCARLQASLRSGRYYRAIGEASVQTRSDGMSAREDYIVPDGVERAGPVVSDGTEHLTPEEQISGGTKPMEQDSGGTEPMDQDSGSSEHLSTGDAGSGDTTVMTPVGNASPATDIMMPDNVSVRTASLIPETVRLTPEEEQSTPMAAGDPNTTRITPTGEGSSRIIKKPYFTGKATTGISPT
ncbi:hypothetical protein R1sor_026266 [Riccia sorocarpa]|uniref:Uncharacterized protein n=1 Tax=Riccia sorocarpa TaxID=122646 RepID=A0ABD3GAW4_9MARC